MGKKKKVPEASSSEPTPIAEEPIAEEPIVEEPIVEEPIVEEPIVEHLDVEDVFEAVDAIVPLEVPPVEVAEPVEAEARAAAPAPVETEDERLARLRAHAERVAGMTHEEIAQMHHDAANPPPAASEEPIEELREADPTLDVPEGSE